MGGEEKRENEDKKSNRGVNMIDVHSMCIYKCKYKIYLYKYKRISSLFYLKFNIAQNNFLKQIKKKKAANRENRVLSHLS